MNIAICDDDLLYMNQVKEMIEKWGKEHHEDVSIYLFNHGDALINSYQKSHIEVILLDIMMPLLNGMETAHEIRKNDSVVKIIFLTSSPEFALESYDVKASGYRKIYYHLIECVEAQNKKVLFCLNDGECLEVLDTFVHCSNELTSNDAFYKCHRSYLVHMPAIDHFNSIEIETKTHKKVPIARSYAKSFKEAYFEYMFKEDD